jgi:hypothetical protein
MQGEGPKEVEERIGWQSAGQNAWQEGDRHIAAVYASIAGQGLHVGSQGHRLQIQGEGEGEGEGEGDSRSEIQDRSARWGVRDQDQEQAGKNPKP